MLAMLHPADHPTTVYHAVRGGHGAPVVCETCGCRLELVDERRFVHYGRLGGRDARGCRIDCAEREHDVLGRPLAG